MAGDRDVVGLEGDRRLGQLSEPGADPAEQVALGLDDLDALERLRRLDVAAVRREDDAVAADERAPRSSSRSP